MSEMSDDIFDGIDGSTMGGERLPYLNPGVYELEIEKITAGAGFDKVPFHRVQLKVLTASGPNANLVGTSAVVVSKRDKFNYAARDIAYFTAAALNEPVKTLKAAELRETASEEQPLKGIKVRAEVTPKEGTAFTRIRWTPMEMAKTPAKGAATTAKAGARL
jgi:hypothetical protein